MSQLAERRREPTRAAPRTEAPAVKPPASARLAPQRVDQKDCADYARSAHLEWLETSGTGAFAMGTVSGTSTRRYHGLLVAAPGPGAPRHVLLSKVDEVLIQGGVETALGTNQYPGLVHPEGHRFLVEFRRDPFPVWTYQVGELRLEKRVFLVQGEATVVVQYRASGPCRLRVLPFVAMRDYHALRSAAGPAPVVSEELREGRRSLVVRSPGLPPLRIDSSAGDLALSGDWYYNTEYLRELDRGLDFREDLFRSGALSFDLDAEVPAWLVASVEPGRRRYDAEVIGALEEAERRRRQVRATEAPPRERPPLHLLRPAGRHLNRCKE